MTRRKISRAMCQVLPQPMHVASPILCCFGKANWYGRQSISDIKLGRRSKMTGKDKLEEYDAHEESRHPLQQLLVLRLFGTLQVFFALFSRFSFTMVPFFALSSSGRTSLILVLIRMRWNISRRLTRS